MKWILFYLNENNNIIYISSLNPNHKEMIPYSKFYNFILKHIATGIDNHFEFDIAINKYKTILLYENGMWEIMDTSDTLMYNHKDIMLYNKDKMIIHQKDSIVQNQQNYKEYNFKQKINKAKNFLNLFSKNKNMQGVIIK